LKFPGVLIIITEVVLRLKIKSNYEEKEGRVLSWEEVLKLPVDAKLKDELQWTSLEKSIFIDRANVRRAELRKQAQNSNANSPAN
jgi:hypothetical protein